MKLIPRLNRLITPKRLALGMCLLLAASLIPLLVIARYNVPSADDYTHGVAGYANWQEHHSVPLLLQASFAYTQNLFHTWTGLYTIGIIPLSAPLVMDQYWIVPYFTLLPLCFAVLFLLFALLRNVFKADAWTSLLMAAVTSLCVVQLVPCRAESFYWHSAATTYTTATALLFVALGLTVWAISKKSGRFTIFYMIFCPLLILVYGGANFITSLGGTALFGLTLCFLLLTKNKAWKTVSVPALFSVLVFLVTVTAPGNAVRQSIDGLRDPSVVTAMLQSLQYGFAYLTEEVSPFLWLSVAFLVPFFVKIAMECPFPFRYPLAVSVLSYLFFSALAFPNFYSLNWPGAGRVLGVYRSVFVVLFLLNALYLVGWVTQKALKRPLPGRFGKKRSGAGPQAPGSMASRFLGYCRAHASLGLLLFALCFVFLALSSIRDKSYRNYATPMAIADLRDGCAREYYEAYQSRLVVLTDPQVKDAVLKELPAISTTLFFEDITQDPLHWKNQAVAQFYQKDSVRIAAPQEAGAE